MLYSLFFVIKKNNHLGYFCDTGDRYFIAGPSLDALGVREMGFFLAIAFSSDSFSDPTFGSLH